MTKPFSMDELLARMRAAVRRSGPAEEQPRVRLGDLVVDLAAKRVERHPAAAPAPATAGALAPVSTGGPAPVTTAGPAPTTAADGADGDGARSETGIRLTPTEWHLLEVLLRHPGKLLSQQQLLTEVWGAGIRERHREPPPLHGAAPPEAGARSGPPALADHRAGHGLSVPARPGRRRG